MKTKVIFIWFGVILVATNPSFGMFEDNKKSSKSPVQDTCTRCFHEPLVQIEEKEFPSRFARENNFIRANLRLSNGKGSFITKYDEYMAYFDSCCCRARKGDATAAEAVSKFYRGLHFDNKKTSILAWDIAKKFAYIAAERGKPDEYIFLTGVDYGAGREMKECTRWQIKQFLENPHGSTNPNHFFALINSWEPRYIDKKSLASLEDYICRSYSKSSNVRLAKAFMLLKGFFGNTKKNNARAFRIACQECLKTNIDSELCNTLDVAGIVLSDLAKKHGYLAKNDPRLYMLGACRVRNNNPFQIMRESTCLLQYYNIVPKQLDKQFKNKRNLCLDLHGYNKGKSVEEVMQLLSYMNTYRDIQSLTIITGKGNHSLGHNPIIKPFIWSILEELAKDQTFSIEYKEDSGGGAFRVWLQR